MVGGRSVPIINANLTTGFDPFDIPSETETTLHIRDERRSEASSVPANSRESVIMNSVFKRLSMDDCRQTRCQATS